MKTISLLTLLLACGEKEADTGNHTNDDTESTEGTEQSVDADGDGFSVADGDCNDEDATIYPYDRSANHGNVGCGWEISMGDEYLCGLSSAGEISCWGQDYLVDNLQAPEGVFVDLSVGTSHACAKDSNNLMTCWGWDIYGQTGNLEEAGGLMDTPVKNIAAGGHQTCVIDMNDQIQCMGGYNAHNWDWSEGPFTMVQSSTYHACGVNSDLQIECVVPQDDTGMPVFELTDEVPAGSYTVVASIYQSRHCALNELGGVICWGSLGDHMTPPTSGVQDLKAGLSDHFCALMDDQTVNCWSSGVLEDLVGQTEPPEGTFQSISLSRTSSCGVTTGGNIDCWGSLSGNPLAW